MHDDERVAFVWGLKAKKQQVKHIHVEGLVTQLVDSYSAASAEIYEVLVDSRRGIVYFDVDAERSSIAEDALLARCHGCLSRFFADVAGFHLDHLITATSHGDRKWSFRFYCDSVVATPAEIKQRIQALELSAPKGGVFDEAVYGSFQKLRAVGSIKTPADPRQLRLVGVPEGDRDALRTALARTIIQQVPPGARRLEASPEPASVTANVAAITTGKRRPHATMEAPRKRGRPRKEDTLPPEWRQVLDNLGFANIHAMGSFADARGSGFGFSADNRRDCPCCANPHDSNNWFIVETADGSFLVKSHSDKCRFRVVKPGATPEQLLSADPVTLEEKLRAMDMEGALTTVSQPGELHWHKFACRRRECLACADDHGGSYDYGLEEVIRDAAWKLSNAAPTCPGFLFHTTATLPSYLTAVVREPSCTSLTQLFLAANSDRLWCEQTLHDVRMWQGRSWMRITPKEFGNLSGDWLVFLLSQTRQMDAFSDSAKQLKEAMNMCKAPAQQQALAQKILSTRSLACRGITFDDDQWLLGCDDCVIDLRIGVARAPKREDMVSITTGYSFLDSDNDPAPIHALMEKVYPVQEERDFIQAFAGYCLTGSCSEKLMLCCTDRRGGSNGKTTLKTVMRRALGQDRYATEGKKELLYHSNNVRDVNAHDAGKLEFEYKRCAIFDEMTSKRALDNAVIKELTSGDAHPSVRAAFGATTRSMTWTAKFVLIFNEGEAPQMRAEDDALMARMVVVQHRAKFCKDDATYAELTARGEDYVHRAGTEGEIDAAITGPRALAWMLEGLDRYRRQGFRRLPESLGKWKRELMMEFDDVAAWAGDHVDVQDGAHFTLAEAHNSFSQMGVSLGKNKFSARLKKLFPGCFRLSQTIAGTSISAVFLGMRLTP